MIGAGVRYFSDATRATLIISGGGFSLEPRSVDIVLCEGVPLLSHKARRKGWTFVDYLRNQHEATTVMPYGVHARPTAPGAAPINWKEMETIDKPSHFHLGAAAELVKRARSKALAGWGRADQALPEL